MTFATGVCARWDVGCEQLGLPVIVIQVVIIRTCCIGAGRCNVEQLTRRNTGLILGEVEQLTWLRVDGRTRLLCTRRLQLGRNRRLLLQRLMRLRVAGLRALLLLQPLLLPLLLLLNRGPAQPDTTRATGQSTEGRGDLLLGLLLQISSASIPGVLQLLLLLMLRLLLLLLSGFAGRLETSQPGKVLDRSRPAERCRPGELRIHADEFVEIVRRELLVGYGTIDALDDSTLPLNFRCHSAVRIFSREASADFAGHDAAKPVRLIVELVFGSFRATSRTAARIIHRPLVA